MNIYLTFSLYKFTGKLRREKNRDENGSGKETERRKRREKWKDNSISDLFIKLSQLILK